LINFNEDVFPLNAAESITGQGALLAQPEDLLHITVQSYDPEAAAAFNPPASTGPNQQMMMQGIQGGNQLELFSGYFVDQQGMIDFPVLGQIPVAGKTLDQIKADLYVRLRPYLNDAVLNIRFLNFKVTVLGEVNAPGQLRLTNQRVTLLEALGQAGDLTPYANRRNILLIREQDGQRIYARINLRKRDLFYSPYFYLKQNDLIYVEPLRARVATVADPAQRFISYSSGVLSVITLILALAK
jgi:polysaccharide export outer membrane protein